MHWIAMACMLALLPLAGRAEPARFDYYLLALSVAPAFSRMNRGASRNMRNASA